MWDFHSLARWAVNIEVWLSYILVRRTYVNGLGQQVDDAAEHDAQRLVEEGCLLGRPDFVARRTRLFTEEPSESGALLLKSVVQWPRSLLETENPRARLDFLNRDLYVH